MTDAADSDLDAAPGPCPHPEHRLGTHGRLKKHQRVCLQCGALVVVRARAIRALDRRSRT